MDDDDLPTINLTPSETNANSTERDGFSYHEDDQPLGNHDQPPQDDALLDSVAALADADIAQGEEATAEAAVVSSTPGQGHDNPPSDPEGEAASEDELARLESSSSSDEDDYSLTDSEAEATREFSHAGAEYRNHWARLHEKAHDRKKELQRLKEEMRGSRDENARLRARIKTLEEPKERHTEVSWPSLFGQASWEKIYRTACMEGNASPLHTKIHPDLSLRKPTAQELQADLLQAGTQPLQEMRSFDIPADIQFQILRCFFDFEGRVVHAISRLDPHHVAAEVPMNRYQKPCFLHRLHVGRAPGRFAKGIRANIQRLQHIEILWAGSQYLTFKINERKKFTSRRTFSLVWLAEAIRLKTLGVYLQESNEMCRRRGHEPRGITHHMQGKTQLHPNFRGFRALRTLQGLDYVTCLRGLDRAEFWDFDRWLATKERKRPVRDWHFIMDVNNSVRRPKAAGDRSQSQLKNIFPLINSFVPSGEDWAILLQGLENRHAVERDSSSESSSDADSDSGSDSSSGSGSESDSDSDDDGDDDSPSQAISQPNLSVHSVPTGEDLGPALDGTSSSIGSSHSNHMIPQFEMLRLLDDNSQPNPHPSAMEVDSDSDDDQESDDEATIVPDDRSVAGHEVVDLTVDGNYESDVERRLNQRLVSQNTAPLVQDSSRADSPIFVSDDGYHPSYPPSSTGQIQDDRSTGNDWEGRSNGSTRMTGSEGSLFIGSEPSYLHQTPSLSGTRRQSSPAASTETNDAKSVAIDLTSEDDLIENFLPSDNLAVASDSRKRDRLKVEEEDDSASENAKRLRTCERYDGDSV